MRVKKINNIPYTSDTGKNYDFNMADKNVERLSCGFEVIIKSISLYLFSIRK